MTVFFVFIIALGTAQIGMWGLTISAVSDSWPQELAVSNPLWGVGIVLVGLLGFICVSVFP